MLQAHLKAGLAAGAFLVSTCAQAALVIPMQAVDGNGTGKSVGAVTVTETAHGLVFTPALQDLPPGMHGFHVHEKPSCDALEKDGKMVAGLAAGGHYDPAASKRHGQPWGDGHLGDLPALYVDEKGYASHPVLAPRLKLTDLKNRSLMIHAGGDNHADHPAPLGGGGARMACGPIL